MKLTLRRIGNSLGVIVPREVLRSWRVGEGDSLELTADGIRPPRRGRSAHAALDILKRAIALAVVERHPADTIRSHSRANLRRWKRGGVWGEAYRRWQEILDSGDDGRLYAAMLGENDESNRLRQSMPFVGMLPQDVLEKLREEAAR